MTSTIWTEKYRPTNFADIRGQKEIVSKIKAFVESGNMPHLLFSGPAGIGKSSLALIIAKELYGQNWKQNFLEMNASDSRGIDIVRGQIKDFARTKSISDVPFKIIFLDEADALTKEAQQALRRTMENYTKTVRFILNANFSSKILDPIQSRCAVFKFKPLNKKEIDEIITNIAMNESGEAQQEISPEVREALYEVSNGDCRRLTNVMQSCFVIRKEGESISSEAVYSMASVAKPKEVNEFLTNAVAGDFLESRKKLLSLMLDYGLSGLDVIKQIQKEIWQLDLEDRKKVELIDKCGETEFRMVEGSDEYIQLESFLAYVVLVGSR
jgi:replication factor C small subunit